MIALLYRNVSTICLPHKCSQLLKLFSPLIQLDSHWSVALCRDPVSLWVQRSVHCRWFIQRRQFVHPWMNEEGRLKAARLLWHILSRKSPFDEKTSLWRETRTQQRGCRVVKGSGFIGATLSSPAAPTGGWLCCRDCWANLQQACQGDHTLGG